jgi:hypothetical protein
MNNTTATRPAEITRFTISKVNGYFILTGSRGATYVATPAFTGDDVTMKIIGGKWGAQVLRNRNGGELHISRYALEEFAA